MSDKRSVSTDALETLGTIITQDAGRDAIHLAVNPTQAREKLRPGQSVTVDGSSRGELVGIVDPFLKGPVKPGEWFWLVVYPRQITSLRHVWEHPAFPTCTSYGPTKAESKAWLRTFARDNYFDYDLLLRMASEEYREYKDLPDAYVKWERSGEYLNVYGTDANGEIPDEFWDHVENVTGKKITDRPKYFTCSC